MTTANGSVNIFSISLNPDHSLSFTLSLYTLLVFIVFVLIVLLIRWSIAGRRANFEIDAAELGIGSHKISFKPNVRDQEIAYKIWVELSTRKIGLPIEFEHDVIVEVYDSWHNFFSITRELIKDIPVSKVQNHSTRKIVTLSISLLNEGLRPHLTTWQARFRRWYDHQLQEAKSDVDPQSIQVKYPRFAELTEDMEKVNRRLILYREKMRELVLGLPDKATDVKTDSIPTL
jgi:hypothetical protein